MSVFHYFSNDATKRATFIFNLIAPLYGMADSSVQKMFEPSMDLLKKQLDIKNKTVLDLGTGTGAWASLFLDNQAARVHGVDISEKMLKQSRKRHPQIEFRYSDIENLSTIEDNAFDIVTASFVIHGVKRDKRLNILSEMERVSKHYAVIHDFFGRTPIPVRLVEFLEKSDYKNFKRNIVDEMKTSFSEVNTIAIGNGSGLYIAAK